MSEFYYKPKIIFVFPLIKSVRLAVLLYILVREKNAVLAWFSWRRVLSTDGATRKPSWYIVNKIEKCLVRVSQKKRQEGQSW